VAWQKARNPWLKPVVLFALETAMRRSELLNAKWKDVNWKDRTLHIPITKNGDARTIPLTPRAVAILAELESISNADDPIFPTTAEAIKLSWKRLTKRATIADLHFHDLRHEAVSRFFELGLTVPEVALISGHKDPRMLFRYTHLRPQAVAQKLWSHAALL
jgi:integrase